MNSDEEEIRSLAYQIWETEGRPFGQSDQHWNRARILVEGLRSIDRLEETTADPTEDS